jgi:hypothetical protein
MSPWIDFASRSGQIVQHFHRGRIYMLQTASGSWFRSSRCAAESSCLEIAVLTGNTIGIRDSKLPDNSPYLTVDRSAWRAFVHGVKAGEFGSV